MDVQKFFQVLFFFNISSFFFLVTAPPPQLTADRGPLHPQEQPGRTIALDVSSECYLLFDDQRFAVKAFRLFHRIPSFGFCVQEHDRPGRLRTELLKELGECTLFTETYSCMCVFGFIWLIITTLFSYIFKNSKNFNHANFCLRCETRPRLWPAESW